MHEFLIMQFKCFYMLVKHSLFKYIFVYINTIMLSFVYKVCLLLLSLNSKVTYVYFFFPWTYTAHLPWSSINWKILFISINNININEIRKLSVKHDNNLALTQPFNKKTLSPSNRTENGKTIFNNVVVYKNNYNQQHLEKKFL